MRLGSANRGFSAGNPLANLLIIIVGALAIGASIVLGLFAFVVLSGVILVMAAVIGIRLWWYNHKFQQASPGTTSPPEARSTGGVIEGEYVVVDEDSDKA